MGWKEWFCTRNRFDFFNKKFYPISSPANLLTVTFGLWWRRQPRPEIWPYYAFFIELDHKLKPKGKCSSLQSKIVKWARNTISENWTSRMFFPLICSFDHRDEVSNLATTLSQLGTVYWQSYLYWIHSCLFPTHTAGTFPYSCCKAPYPTSGQSGASKTPHE